MVGTQLASTDNREARSTSDSLNGIFVSGFALTNGYGGVQSSRTPQPGVGDADGVGVGVGVPIGVGVGVGGGGVGVGPVPGILKIAQSWPTSPPVLFWSPSC